MELAITVNGEPRLVPAPPRSYVDRDSDAEEDRPAWLERAPAALADLLRHLNLDPRTIVVEHNRRIVRRPQLHETALAEGDSVELVHFVGGG